MDKLVDYIYKNKIKKIESPVSYEDKTYNTALTILALPEFPTNPKEHIEQYDFDDAFDIFASVLDHAKKGHVLSKYLYAMILNNHSALESHANSRIFINENLELSFSLSLEAAELDHKQAQLICAANYFYGIGIEKDFDKCVFWLNKAACGDSPEPKALGWLSHFALKDNNTEVALALSERGAFYGDALSKEIMKKAKLEA